MTLYRLVEAPCGCQMLECEFSTCTMHEPGCRLIIYCRWYELAWLRLREFFVVLRPVVMLALTTTAVVHLIQELLR